MAFVHGKDTAFQLDGESATLVDIRGFLDSVSGLPGARELSEVTSFGNQGTQHIPGLENVSFSVSGSWDPTTVTGPHAVLAFRRNSSVTGSFEYGPAGSGSGMPKLSGECWVTNYTIDSAVADKVSFSADFQVNGVVTFGTYA